MANPTTNPVAGWDERVLVATETTFGTITAPAASQYMQWYDLDMGPNEQQDTRPIKDKTIGRGETAQFVSGRVKPMKWKGKTSQKTRTAVDAVPVESPLYIAAGLVQTVNGGTNVTYSFSSAPAIIGGTLCMYSARGAVPYEAEQGFGGVVEELDWSFADRELTLDIAGGFVGKYWLGQASATVADGVTTTVNFDNSGDAYKVSLGWYNWESEIIQVTAVNYAGNSMTVLRAQLASSGAAHTAKNITPFVPTGIAIPTTTPISEANVTITIDGIATRCTKGAIKLKTGLSHLPGESGNVRVQGAKAIRYSIKGEVEYVVTDDTERIIGKMNQRKNCAFVITCGTGVGGIATFTLNNTVLEPFAVPAPNNDISIAKLGFHPRDANGNDMMTMVLT